MSEAHKHTTASLPPTEVVSRAIDLLRFPMAVLVVLHHLLPYTFVPLATDAPAPILSAEGIVNFTIILLSRTLGRIAVPTFFIISGYLFFLSLPRDTFDMRAFGAKMKRRVRSRVVPYLLWNILPFLCCITYGTLSMLKTGDPQSLPYQYKEATFFGIIWDMHIMQPDATNFFGQPFPDSAPFNTPLWFMRDLIVAMILSPLIYWLVRRLKLFVLALLFISFYLKLWPYVPGLTAYSCFYFALGAYFALIPRERSFLPFLKICGGAITLLALIATLLITAIGAESTPLGLTVFPFYQLIAALALLNIASVLATRGYKANPWLIPACFFLYATHAVAFIPYRGGPLSIIQKAVNTWLHPGDHTPFLQAASYTLTALLTITFCLTLYAILRRTLPHLTHILTGKKPPSPSSPERGEQA